MIHEPTISLRILRARVILELNYRYQTRNYSPFESLSGRRAPRHSALEPSHLMSTLVTRNMELDTLSGDTWYDPVDSLPCSQLSRFELKVLEVQTLDLKQVSVQLQPLLSVSLPAPGLHFQVVRPNAGYPVNKLTRLTAQKEETLQQHSN